MDDRLKALGLGALRMGMVAVALVVASSSVVLSAVSTFCPDTSGASGNATVTLASSASMLATVVEDGTELPSELPTDGASDPATEPAPAPLPDGVRGDSVESTEGDGSCPGGVRACAPPLISSVLRYGDADCAEQASGELRARLVPAVLVSIGLLGGAWALRPRFGDSVISRG